MAFWHSEGPGAVKILPEWGCRGCWPRQAAPGHEVLGRPAEKATEKVLTRPTMTLMLALRETRPQAVAVEALALPAPPKALMVN
ncbi:UNVERIFIED_CONTAM: hypothetical protein K2H54_003330 [Gekko kuhli]